MARRFDFSIEPMTLGNMRELGVRSRCTGAAKGEAPDLRAEHA
jgi:hypothetical protein